MTDDTISRQAAIDAITQYLGRIKRDFKQWEGTAKIILDHVPSAQPGWIQCSERLPENSDSYYVTVKWWDGNTFTEECSYNHEYKEWNDGKYDDYGAVVIAWMPWTFLPKPWEEGGQDG